jgi:repressor LexA
MCIYLPLTEQQNVTLKYIYDFMSLQNFPPTIKEIMLGAGFKNPGHVHKILFYLSKKGYITKIKNQHRSIRISELGKNFIQMSKTNE